MAPRSVDGVQILRGLVMVLRKSFCLRWTLGEDGA